MEDSEENRRIFISRWAVAKSCPCLIVYTEKGKNEAEALQAFVLTPFFHMLFFTPLCTFPERDSHERSRFISPKALMWPCYICEDSVLTLHLMKREEEKLEERESYTTCRGTRADRNAKCLLFAFVLLSKWHIQKPMELAKAVQVNSTEGSGIMMCECCPKWKMWNYLKNQ